MHDRLSEPGTLLSKADHMTELACVLEQSNAVENIVAVMDDLKLCS